MFVLFDQGTPVPVRPFLKEHTVQTTAQRGWTNQGSAFLYTSGSMINLDPPYAPDPNDPTKIFTPISSAWAINDVGQIGGAATMPPPPNSFISHIHAVVFRQGLQPIDLGTLGGNESFARGINSGGQLVGYSLLPNNSTQHAARFVIGGSPIDLDGLPNRASAAIAINDAGTIAPSLRNFDYSSAVKVSHNRASTLSRFCARMNLA